MTTAAAATVPDRPRWTGWHTFGLLGILILVVTIGVLLPREAGRVDGYDQARLVAWLAILALFGSFATIAGHGITGLLRGLFVDGRNKVSLSRLQMFLWTILVLSGFLAAALANVGTGDPRPLNVNIPSELWLAMGISTTSMVASPAVLHRRRKRLARKDDSGESRWTDLFTCEEIGEEGRLDLGKIQLFLFTVVLTLGYGVALADAFTGGPPVIRTLPPVDSAFVVLLSISHAGYLAKKAVPLDSRSGRKT